MWIGHHLVQINRSDHSLPVGYDNEAIDCRKVDITSDDVAVMRKPQVYFYATLRAG